MFSVKQISNSLGISTATFLNWKKAGLIPQLPLTVTDNSFEEYIAKIRANTQKKLLSRANRSFSNEKMILYQGISSSDRKALLDSLVQTFENSLQSIESAVLSLIICQLRSENLLCKSWQKAPKTRIEVDCKHWLEECSQTDNIDKNSILSLFASFSIKNCDDDILGAFYQSIQSISEKSNKGSFYTPSELLANISVDSRSSIYDPCCGSGNILLKILSKQHDSALIYASDIDKIALRICETNLVLYFNEPNIESTVFCYNFLQKNLLYKQKFDFIITNPPWGAKFTSSEKEQVKRDFQFLNTTESFAISLYNATNLLSDTGSLCFFLPKSFLNVTCHKFIRKCILDISAFVSIRMLGQAFKGVVSEAIFLQIEKAKKDDGKIHIFDNNPYSLDKKECKSPDYFICAKQTSVDECILQKIYASPHTFLENNAKFALGIVTGNNQKYVFKDRRPNSEAIYRGKSISPFFLAEPLEFIEFHPENFQQCAPSELYKTKKIVYRFIANKIICCISCRNELMLNSANVFIPMNNYSMETIVCLFNSSVYAYLYKKKFDSVKILRSQLEKMPLPLFTEEKHQVLINIYKEILEKREVNLGLKKIDAFLAEYFELSSSEMEYIQSFS